MPTTAAVQSVQSVTFPALARIKEDPVKFAESYRQVVMIMAYVMFPALLGLGHGPRPVRCAAGSKWQPTVPYFEVVCGAGLFYSISMISYNVLKIKSRGPLIVRLEIVKKLIMTIVFAATIPPQYHGRGLGPCGDLLLRDGRQFFGLRCAFRS